MLLKGRKIIVTGATGDIARGVIAGLELGDADVYSLHRGPGRGGGCDLSTRDGISQAASEIAAHAPDILINLAGTQYFGAFPGQPEDNVLTTYMVNLIAPVLLTQAALPAMIAKGCGQIVNIGSIFGSINYPYFVTYSSAKAGLYGFSQGLRRELRGSGVGVTYIAPRAVKTRLHDIMVQRFCALTKMRLDEPQIVALRILRAIEKREKNVYIGAPEAIIVKLNALFPGALDVALSPQIETAKKLFSS